MIGDMREARAWVRADFEHNAVVVETLDGEAELIVPVDACRRRRVAGVLADRR
jgi:hypothetical protein